MKPTAKTPQSSALPTRSPVCVQATSKGVVATAQAPSVPVVAEEESDSSEEEAPTLVRPERREVGEGRLLPSEPLT